MEKAHENHIGKTASVKGIFDLATQKKFGRRRLKEPFFNIGKFMQKSACSGLALVVASAAFMSFLPQARVVPVGAEAATSFTMDVDLNDYYLDVQDSAYHAWRGKVTLSGNIDTGSATSGSIVAYFDSILEPVFTVDTTTASIVDGKYEFSTLVDTVKYTRGYHTLRIYDGAITSFETATPILSVPVYVEYSEIATITNVSSTCNMRLNATTVEPGSPIVTTVPLGACVDVLNRVTGQYVSLYGTDIWYQVRYQDANGTIHTGYILSYFISKMTLGISKMNVTAADSVVEDFLPGKTAYGLNLPFTAYTLSVQDIAIYNPDDTLEVLVNGVGVAPPYTSLALTTGDNTVEFVVTSADASTSMTYTFNIWRIAETTEAEFQAQLAKFPAGYRTALLTLHAQYPNWLFTAFNTGLDWETVVSAHDSGNISLIENYTLPEYKYSDVIQDGNSFVRASRAAVEYYLDPRNFFGADTIFQFELLSYQSSVPDAELMEGITKILAGSGLAGFETMFLNAGKASGVSPYHLASRSKQEVTTWSPIGLSKIATGTYTFINTSGVTDYTYYGYYNFYNIGTGSSTDFNVLYQRGLGFAMGTNAAYDLPWNTAEKAIVGGGKYIGANYINAGQNTLYLQKFDVDPTNGLYIHEYMQNVRAPYFEAKGSYNAYNNTGCLSNSFVFRIPVYTNMPTLNAPKPEDTNKLNTLCVSGYTLTPAFTASSDTVYQATVPTSVDKITLTATTLNSNATISGTGEKSLLIGDENVFTVTCTPSNGAARTYTVQVTRSVPEESSNNLLAGLSISAGSMGIDLAPAFSAGQTGPFRATVSDTVSEAVVSATAQTSLAAVSGTGVHPLAYGENTLEVQVEAENGDMRTYSIQITRNIPKVTSASFALTEGTISGIPLATTIGALKSGINSLITTLRCFTPGGQECLDTDLAGTGSVLKVYFGSTLTEQYTVLMFGDISGDGKINSTDYASLKIHILKLKLLGGKQLEACDVNKDGKVNSTDYAMIKIHILKLKDISQK